MSKTWWWGKTNTVFDGDFWLLFFLVKKVTNKIKVKVHKESNKHNDRRTKKGNK